MSEEQTLPDGDQDAPSGTTPSRMRFKGIVEAESASDGAPYGVLTINPNERYWNAVSRQVWLAGRLTALFVFFSFVVGPPLGNFLAHRTLYGTTDGWQVFAAFGTDTILFAIIVPLLILVMGYMLSRSMMMTNAAETIAAAAQQYVTPDVTAAHNADAVGEVVRGHMVALNEGLDGALGQLANVESLIRQHVEAIELAGDAIEHKATGAVTRVADERSRLMELTESLNAHADSFAAAIAERAKASIEALQSADQISERAEQDFDERLHRLEHAANQAVESFESLRAALVESTQEFGASSQSIDEAARQTELATKRATAAANAAAESAAINAANVTASATRAADTSRKAADDAIEAATKEAERIAAAAMEAATEQTARVQDAAKKALGDMSGATNEAVEAARLDAEKATKAAEDVSQAAKRASDAAQKASSDVVAASEQARKNSDEALTYSQNAATKIEERNKALADARAALEKENIRLESLIDEQRQRADRLAEAIASQTDRLTRLAEAQLREQEAAARLAEAQNEMQARAAEEAKRKKTEEEAQEAKRAAAEKAAQEKQAAERAAQEEQKKQKAAKDKSAHKDDELPLTASNRVTKAAPKDSTKKGSGTERLEELAKDIAQRRPRKQKNQRERLSIPERIGAAAQKEKAAEAKSKSDVSWREILDAAEDAEPIELGPAAKPKGSPRDEAADAIRVISELQNFTYNLETRLYGDPPATLQERYERGDRNVFANRLLRLNEADVKRRIRSESARDRNFEHNVHEFLQGFEKLLEDATTSETADEELEEYLSSPLGRVYLLIGATVGYFA